MRLFGLHNSTDPIRLNWKDDINAENSLPPIDYAALVQYAKDTHQRHMKYAHNIECQLSDMYNIGGLHLVRLLDFGDGTTWLARLQLQKGTAASCQRLIAEVHTIQLVREKSNIRVPEVFSYDASCDNSVGDPFMLLEYIQAITAMDSFGGWDKHKGRIPQHFRTDYHASMANIQVEIASIRFPMIGRIVKLSDGTFSIGELPGIGGPFKTAAEFFCAWADNSKFPYDENFIRERTSAAAVDEIISSIKGFPARLRDFARHYTFQNGPYPLIHSDLYSSNVLVDSQCRIKGVIDWENAIVGPWEIVEVIKDLSIVPRLLDGPFYREKQSDQEMMADRKRYIQAIKEGERASRVSETLDSWNTQNFAHAIWLYSDGRIGYYSRIFELFTEINARSSDQEALNIEMLKLRVRRQLF
ncbi:hypothetical protein BDV95DRAFT_651482 [Massariosphaeria phaeospora]|uniref:Aminoglycoside phosphotransferase domain-containing protein n=1 Tax=Massariosphaeria phaeospora TaxID=100035 RepID=A0A7C8M7Q2_9PLEO|nr:hypothetical protein BDV95DRAFT_651482 [Massariosphaeria phaeospora]